eukprot:CAMPEP_0202500412 /NCGR_PEP_ID=MMETSP1361-20130828/33051_1 /ASSEMBLY_ACC=CAM_ASM_000849 /TAXON_ID=210615 /ORGANISM="Staurosira complex sp., Strain CCMP2646" /LENGTH=115 /DNA_ID=CAMNT_0049132861 /DNA_START=33 /DNA_END=380 /DNA_ORIENTATION=-
MALQHIGKSIFGRVAGFYRANVAKDLSAVGLRYEDLINENEPDMEEALTLADPSVVTARNRRLKRAIDLDFKKKLFTDYAPDVPQETFKFELDGDLKKIRERNLEYELLNASYKK